MAVNDMIFTFQTQCSKQEPAFDGTYSHSWPYKNCDLTPKYLLIQYMCPKRLNKRCHWRASGLVSFRLVLRQLPFIIFSILVCSRQLDDMNCSERLVWPTHNGIYGMVTPATVKIITCQIVSLNKTAIYKSVSLILEEASGGLLCLSRPSAVRM